jgi:Flp pilus assembly protein TadB
MEIPVTLFGVIVAGLLGVYVAIIYRAFQFSRDLETDFYVVVQNLKTRELSKIIEFIEVETSEAPLAVDSELSSNQRRSREDRVKKLMEERWKNAYSCYQAEALINRLQRGESLTQKWCIGGIICVALSFLVYILPLVSKDILKICIVLLLCFLPLVIIAYLFFKNLSICHNIRNLKKDMEKIWQF